MPIDTWITAAECIDCSFTIYIPSILWFFVKKLFLELSITLDNFSHIMSKLFYYMQMITILFSCNSFLNLTIYNGILWQLSAFLLWPIHGWKFSRLILNSGFWGWLSTESQPQNAELGRSQHLLRFILSLSKDNWPFKLEIVIFSGHTSSFKIGVSKVQDFGTFRILELSSMPILFTSPYRVELLA